MNLRRRYLAIALMLVVVTALLAVAEEVWWFWGLTVIAAVWGWFSTVVRDNPPMGPGASRAFVVIAFCLLIFEYAWLLVIPVLALSHFMTLVCVCKLIQRRTARDDAQLFVLSLLLLVVAAIVSGNLLFPIALVIYLTLGVDALVQFHLALEESRAEQRNRQIAGISDPPTASAVENIRSRSATAVLSLTALGIGVAVFVLCPRVGAGMFGRFENPTAGRTITGFAHTLNFNSIGPITESDVPVMRVQVERNGRPVELTRGPYLRGAALAQYHCEQPLAGRGWEWRRFSSSASALRTFVTCRIDEDGVIPLLAPGLSVEQPMLVHRFWIEPSESLQLFTCYPAIDLRFESQGPDEVKKWIDDHVIQMQRGNSKVLRYVLRSPEQVTRHVAEMLDEERRLYEAEVPQVVLPDEPLPREREILELIEEIRTRADIGPLSDSNNHEKFAKALEAWFHSGRFTYTLEPPRVPGGQEPIGVFLFETRRGHCEYFASAMTVMCQLAGIPARVVSGYCGGDYNPVGQFYIVRQKHAHSWVEVFLPGRDWTTFDPTPTSATSSSSHAGLMRGLAKYFDYMQFLWANLVVSYDQDQRRSLFEKFEAWVMRPMRNENTIIGAVTAFVRELFGWRLQLDWRERLIYWVFALLVLALVVLLSYVVWFTGRWSWRKAAVVYREHVSRRGPREVDFYVRFSQRLQALGLTRRPDQTPAEFAEELAAHFPVFSEAPHLVQSYYEVMFGGRKLSNERRSRINSFLDRIGQIEDLNPLRAPEDAPVPAVAE